MADNVKTPHIHAKAIKAWADGAEIEFRNHKHDWVLVKEKETPAWYPNLQYRIKQSKPKDKHMEALIVLSPHAGPLLYAAAPDEANCSLVFDGTTNKLIKVEVKSPVEAPKRPSEAFDSMFQGHGSLDALNRLGVR